MATKEDVLKDYGNDIKRIYEVLKDYSDMESVAILGGSIVLLLKSIEIASEKKTYGEEYLSALLDDYKNSLNLAGVEKTMEEAKKRLLEEDD